MNSLETPWLRREAATLGLLAAVAVSGSGAAQLRSGGAGDAQLVEQIVEAQVVGGAYAKELIDPLTALSFLYAENGNHSLAVAVSEQALQVIRANYGLRTLEQAPLIRQRIRSEEARGNHEEAWRLEQALLDLGRRNLDDVRAAPILHELGDKRLDLLARYVRGERPPQLFFGCYYRPFQARQGPVQEPGSCTSGQKHIAEMSLLLEAQSYYADAINTLRRNELWGSDELHELEASWFAAPMSTAAHTAWAKTACADACAMTSRIRRHWNAESRRCCSSPTGSSCSAICKPRRTYTSKSTSFSRAKGTGNT
jgi:tetratricopeptide (TPR) repeat protein